MAGLEVAKGATVAAPLVAAGLPSTTPARVPVGAYVAPRRPKVAVTMEGRADVEAEAVLVPEVAVGPVPRPNHAVAHPDVEGRASGLVGPPSVRDLISSLLLLGQGYVRNCRDAAPAIRI